MSCYLCNTLHGRTVPEIADCAYAGCGRGYCGKTEHHGQHCTCSCGTSICQTHINAHMREVHGGGDPTRCFPQVFGAAALAGLVRIDQDGVATHVTAPIDELLGTPKPPDTPFAVSASAFVESMLPGVLDASKTPGFARALDTGRPLGWSAAAFTPVVMLSFVPTLVDTARRARARLEDLDQLSSFSESVSDASSAMLERLSAVSEADSIGAEPLSETAQSQFRAIGGRLGREMTALAVAATQLEASQDNQGVLDAVKLGAYVGPWVNQSDEVSRHQNATLGAAIAPADREPPMLSAD